MCCHLQLVVELERCERVELRWFHSSWARLSRCCFTVTKSFFAWQVFSVSSRRPVLKTINSPGDPPERWPGTGGACLPGELAILVEDPRTELALGRLYWCLLVIILNRHDRVGGAFWREGELTYCQCGWHNRRPGCSPRPVPIPPGFLSIHIALWQYCQYETNW